jgi:hypothetical protein
MPLMGWNAFCVSWPRPFMVRADLEAAVTRDRLEVLRHFLRSMGLAGHYALYPGLAFVWLAFELESDASRVVHVVDARKVGPGPSEWAAMWTFDLDSPTFKQLKSRRVMGKRPPGIARAKPKPKFRR